MKKFFFCLIVVLSLFNISMSAFPISQDAHSMLKVGDYISFGNYNNQPIIWRVINNDAQNGILLWSDKIITIKSYDSTGNKDYSENLERERVGSNLWASSTLRDWLNSDQKKVSFTHNPPDETNVWQGHNDYANEPGFLYNFSLEEKSLITPSINKSILAEADIKLKEGGSENFVLHGSRNPMTSVENYDTAYFHFLTDKVFLLDIKQISDFVAKRKFEFKKSPTKEAVDLTEYKTDLISCNKNFVYWVRTPVSSTAYSLLRISGDGVVGDVMVDNRNLGVVPAMYIKPDFFIQAGVGTQISPFLIGQENNNYIVPKEEEMISIGEQVVNWTDDSDYCETYDANSINKLEPWAYDGVDFVKNEKILNDSFFGQYKKNITRKEFAYVAVRLYEYLTKTSLDTSYIGINNIFADTNDEFVRKAFYIGIMNGYGNNNFGANDEITREQVMVLIMKLLSKASIKLNNNEAQNIVFNDEIKISEWAKEYVKKAYFYKIINGVGPLKISPKNKLTKEQTLIIVYNIMKNVDSLGDPDSKGRINPVLKWAYGGTYETWAEDGWYSTPAVADLNQDGNMEIIGSAYSISNLDAQTGKLIWRVASGHDINEQKAQYEGRTWADIIVKDIDNDGNQEIISAHNKGYISVYDKNGVFKKGWPQKPVSDEIRSLKVNDLDLDGKMEIIASVAGGSGKNLWVFNFDGTLKKGWPQLDTFHDSVARSNAGLTSSPQETSFAWGVFNNSLSVGNINSDKYPEIIMPSDVPFVCAYDKDGNLLDTNPIFSGRKWGQVGFWESQSMENKLVNEGWGLAVNDKSPTAERNTVNFASSGSTIDDLDGDGINEIVITGNVYDRLIGHPPGLYITPFVLNADRTRFNKGGFDFSESPKNTGAPLSEDYNLIEACMPNPVTSDIDNDGFKEIIFSSYDGKVHCFSLSKEEKNSWPYSVYNPNNPRRTTYEFASEPAVVDIDDDGFEEVIFSTWTEKEPDINQKTFNGRMIILSYKGELISETELPFSLGTKLSNGGLSSPLVVDIDQDNQYEIVLNTIYSGIVAYDLVK